MYAHALAEKKTQQKITRGILSSLETSRLLYSIALWPLYSSTGFFPNMDV